MPTVTPIPLLKGDVKGVEADWRDALPINMYAVPRKILGADGYMKAYPGISLFATGSGRDRGAIYNERQGIQYRVSGQKLISVDDDGTVVELGDIPGNSQAAMPYSFNTQAVIADGRYFLYDTTSGFREITDPDVGDPLDAVWVDNYYFFTDGENIYHTDIDDEESIDPLKFATAEFMPDDSLGVSKTQDNKVMVWGRYSLEYFVNVATDNFAFQRVETRAQKIGIVATHAKTEVMGTYFIVGGRKDESIGVHAVSIGSAEKVSTREIDKVIEAYTEDDLVNIRVESRMEKDIMMVLIHLPNETLMYNITVGNWSILTTREDNMEATHRAINGVFDPTIPAWVYGDKFDAHIGKLDESIFSQYSDEIQEWGLFTPIAKLETQTIEEIEIETIPGLGASADDDAQVFISLTYNGLTYGTETIMEYGSPLEYNMRFIKRRLGYVSDWVGFKFRGATRSVMSFGLFKVTHG